MALAVSVRAVPNDCAASSFRNSVPRHLVEQRRNRRFLVGPQRDEPLSAPNYLRNACTLRAKNSFSPFDGVTALIVIFACLSLTARIARGMHRR